MPADVNAVLNLMQAMPGAHAGNSAACCCCERQPAVAPSCKLPPSMNVPAETLSSQIDSIFSPGGMSGPAREACVRLMIAADLRGIDSHGVMMLPLYDELRREGRLKMEPDVKVVGE